MFNLLHVVLPPSSLPSIGFQGVFFFFAPDPGLSFPLITNTGLKLGCTNQETKMISQL